MGEAWVRLANRRQMLGVGVAAMAAPLTPPAWALASAEGLTSMADAAQPISTAERQGRLARAQGLMRRQGVSALLVEAGASMVYFTGVDWWRSERLTAAILPVEGEALVVTPFFEEPSIRETLAIPAEVRVWQEDEQPAALMAAFLRERKLDRGTLAVEETVRYFAVDHLQQALPELKVTSGAPIVRPCRLIKSAAEIDLLQLSNDIQVAAYRHVAPKIERGMGQDDIKGMLHAAVRALGGRGDDALVLIGESSAYPHGSNKPQRVADGEIILLDAGCTLQGYTSDISRTMVFGTPTPHQREVFAQVRHGQDTAMRAAQIGVPAGKVDDAVRAYYASLGYGPGYKLPGTPHRTGHGIGLDGHEPVNLVHGETTPLAVGMCFSNEPGIYIPGQFGVRIEDCFHITPEGPRFFTQPPTSLDQPFG